MKILSLIAGIICYCIALYWMFFYDPNTGDYWYSARSYSNPTMFNLVKGDAYNFMYAYLASIAVSVMGTGFIIMGAPYDK